MTAGNCRVHACPPTLTQIYTQTHTHAAAVARKNELNWDRSRPLARKTARWWCCVHVTKAFSEFFIWPTCTLVKWHRKKVEAKKKNKREREKEICVLFILCWWSEIKKNFYFRTGTEWNGRTTDERDREIERKDEYIIYIYIY